ncbi:SgcJ/EcaC family oxidoreductase [Nonomuraea sp. NPDC050556]|uniref:SgcJ/EcaC family oxidoreductase n=1 Tax=Nonomuraea sp. NPDC050556 TaxID=3364369 RepID=UPI0037BAA494
MIDRTTDREAIVKLMDDIADAWDRHDPEAYGAAFTEDATYTSFIGTEYRGRDDLAEGHRAGWEKFLKGTRMYHDIVDLRFYGPDTAIITTHGEVSKGKRPAKLPKVQTMTAVREADGRWRVAAFQNTKHQTVMEAISFLWAPETKPAAQQ